MQPLAERMRPQSLETFYGQNHLVADGQVLHNAVKSGNIPSMIFWGPPGVGKTTLAQIIAQSLDRPFHILSAINAGVKDIRETIDKARRQQFFDAPNPVVFIDEIHRFSKSQQDALLGAVEKGVFTLIGATTENPSFEVNSALLSRCQVYILEQLSKEDLIGIVEHALTHDIILQKLDIQINEYDALLKISGGDARKLLNCLEIIAQQASQNNTLVVTDELVIKLIQENLASYDKTGEQHYDIISAFIKSIRGSDPNAAIYYLARMVEGGEDPKFICRRMIISASEDIGLANPNALLMANNCFQAVHQIGMPEGRIVMAQCAVYMALSPKSNASYNAINKAQKLVRETGNLAVPLHLRNAPTTLMQSLGYGQDYAYSHDFRGHFIDQEYLPDNISGTDFFIPGDSATERKYHEQMLQMWKGKYLK